MGESEKYTEAIYTAPETLHSSNNNNNNNNRRSHFKTTDLEDPHMSDATLSALLAPLTSFRLYFITFLNAQGQTAQIGFLLWTWKMKN